MGMTVHGKDGQAFNPIMGCYGIGVGRAIASIAQESNYDSGLILPMSVAPWQVHVCALRYDDEKVAAQADAMYKDLTDKGVEVLFDDRNCGAGFKFADADLMGMPIRIVVSPKTLADGEVEICMRETKKAERVALKDCTAKVKAIIAEEMKRYK